MWSATLPSPVLAAYILTQDLRLEKVSLTYANTESSQSPSSSSYSVDSSVSEHPPTLRIEKYGTQYFVFPPTIGNDHTPNTNANKNAGLIGKDTITNNNNNNNGGDFPLTIRPKSGEMVNVDGDNGISTDDDDDNTQIIINPPLIELINSSKTFEDRIRDNSLAIIAIMGAIIVSLLAGIVSWNLSRSFYGQQQQQQVTPPSNSANPSLNSNNNNSDDKQIQAIIDDKGNNVTVGSDGVVHVGKMDVYTNKVLGRGSIGTVVFEGRVDERRVAVKRILKEFYNLAQREISLLLVSDEHPNLVRYYSKEEDNDFIYLSITYCVSTLGDWVTNTIKSSAAGSIVTPEKVAMMKGIAAGVAHIHLLNIVHRDLKPENILIDPQGNPRISDMGLAKKFEGSKFSYSILNAGSAGWMAPEILRLKNRMEYEENIRPQIFPSRTEEEDDPTSTPTLSPTEPKGDDEVEEEVIDDEKSEKKKIIKDETTDKTEKTTDKKEEMTDKKIVQLSISSSSSSSSSNNDGNSKVIGESVSDGPDEKKHPMVTKAVDVFSLGCIFYYIATGNHPFGPKLERDMNILQGNINLRDIYSQPELVDLVRKMTNQNSWKRISAKNIVNHPFFWDSQRQLQFMLAASDRLEVESQQADIVVRYEDMMREKRLTLHWDRKLDHELLNNLKCYRKYNYNAARDLLRVLRNKANHYYDLPPEVQNSLGSLPDGFMNYFKSRFPRLLILTYNFLSYECYGEPAFSSFFFSK